MFDNFEVIANLHLGRFAPAADGIDRILAAAKDGPYLRAPLHAASTEVGEALAATRPPWIGKSPRLAAHQAKLQDLRTRLTP